MISVNLIGTFNTMRLAAGDMQALSPLDDGERGVIVSTASVAAYDGQIGQAAYAASKGGVVSLMLPAAREFAQFGIRVMAIAPGIFNTPMVAGMPEQVQEGLAASIPFPKVSGSRSNMRTWRSHHREPLSQRRGDPARRCGAAGATVA